MIEGVSINNHMRYFKVIGRMNYEGDNGQRLISIDQPPLKVMISSG